ncbi:Lsr2 family protein [Actinophytocola sp.]|uniref:histone-like nucleoid-structuring protein Lsr2 n=1 Tax=Actinophytocola sp. TaxID=1872138 RepID=UPI002D80C44A|nr:Lsr2 family protein [Actinophytocola sp.]HET9138850.1 Lsr2 family protein [Actinophytocola sp.]HEU5109227.1 Lsr2 family protein [Micromonosporaceae bacterium]
MAQKVIVELVDDLDGTASDDISTVSFGLDGAEYEIDLTEANADNLRAALEGYVAAARRTGGRIKRGTRPVTGSGRPAASRDQTRAIREWARENGFELADRGRIPVNVIEAFDEAQANAEKPKARGRKAKKPAFSA